MSTVRLGSNNLNHDNPRMPDMAHCSVSYLAGATELAVMVSHARIDGFRF
jgi:hypothetical protein